MHLRICQSVIQFGECNFSASSNSSFACLIFVFFQPSKMSRTCSIVLASMAVCLSLVHGFSPKNVPYIGDCDIDEFQESGPKTLIIENEDQAQFTDFSTSPSSFQTEKATTITPRSTRPSLGMQEMQNLGQFNSFRRNTAYIDRCQAKSAREKRNFALTCFIAICLVIIMVLLCFMLENQRNNEFLLRQILNQ